MLVGRHRDVDPPGASLAPRDRLHLADVLRSHPQTPAYVAEDAVLEGLTGFHLHRGALAVMRRPAPVPVERVLDALQRGEAPADDPATATVLDTLHDHGCLAGPAYGLPVTSGPLVGQRDPEHPSLGGDHDAARSLRPRRAPRA